VGGHHEQTPQARPLGAQVFYSRLCTVIQADATKLPTRVLSIASADGSENVTLKVNQNGEVVAEFASKTGRKGLTAAKSDARKPVGVLVQWDSISEELTLRVRDANAAAITTNGNLTAPSASLFKLNLGRADGAVADQFHGYLAELVIYASSLKTDQSAILLRDLSDYYLLKPVVTKK
jgi:hypothetical protein